MGEVAALFAASSASNAIGTAATTYSQAQAIKAQGNYNKNQMEFNAQVADLQAKDAIIRGDKAIAQKRRQTRQTIGSQRAALAAQGIDVNQDTALQIQEDTAALGAEDVVTIKNNAMREAWGYRVQNEEYTNAAKFEDLSTKTNVRNTVLTGGLQFARDVSSGTYNYARYGDSLQAAYDKKTR